MKHQTAVSDDITDFLAMHREKPRLGCLVLTPYAGREVLDR
ncbi:hypothetical protein V3G39_13455 [Dermatophilaceae bacterium Sec6.4]